MLRGSRVLSHGALVLRFINVAMRILGIDPGLQTTGYGVIDVLGTGSQTMSYVASGTILPERLKILFDGVQEICRTYQPDVASVEIVFVNVNPQSTLLLGQARGACITGLVSCDVAVAEYTALQLKQAVVGYGKAQKSQVQEMVMRLLKLPSLPGPDAADALGIAITHAHSHHSQRRLAASTAVGYSARPRDPL
jgi:crossover junction endodeoxyribonuclease RuvC